MKVYTKMKFKLNGNQFDSTEKINVESQEWLKILMKRASSSTSKADRNAGIIVYTPKEVKSGTQGYLFIFLKYILETL